LKATLSRSLNEIIKANSKISKDPRNINVIKGQIDGEIQTEIRSGTPNNVKLAKLKLQQEITNKFINQINNISTSHSNDTRTITTDIIHNNKTTDQIIQDFQNPSGKYSKAFIEDLIPEININNRKEIANNINSMGPEYKAMIDKRIHELTH
jgi:hypothetical protein